jgi:hypothetical protein
MYQRTLTVTFTKDVTSEEEADNAANDCVVALLESQVTANIIESVVVEE